jgi:CMP-N-acetylneuraminic acid synthetase
MISVVIRTRNEERWIAHSLRRIRSQSVDDLEIVLVDNDSTDTTVAKAIQVCPDLTLVSTSDFRPGRAINEGIRRSRGDLIVLLSAHCLPVSETWLEVLRRGLDDPEIAGVYGRQIPMAFSDATDKRDLLVTFGLDRRVQRRDPFFHNANSIIRRELWERYPFDEEVSNIEDRVWGQRMIDAGFALLYEPEAAVYHYHGIHQRGPGDERAEGVARVMEQLRGATEPEPEGVIRPEDLEIVAVVSARANTTGDAALDQRLLTLTGDAAFAARHLDRVLLMTDSEQLQLQGRETGFDAPYRRPPELSDPGVRADEVLRYTLGCLEQDGYYPDVVVPLEITFPFRPSGLIDELIEQLLREGLDTAIAGFPEYRACWMRTDGHLQRVDRHAVPRGEREPLHIGLASLGCATYPAYIRRGTRFGTTIGILEIDDPVATVEIRTAGDAELLDALLPAYQHLASL